MLDISEEKREHAELVNQLVHVTSVLTDGSIAVLTAFEPRLFRFGPQECSWMILQKLMRTIEVMSLATLALTDSWMQNLLSEPKYVAPSEILLQHGIITQELRLSAQALQSQQLPEEAISSLETLPNDAVSTGDLPLPLFFESIFKDMKSSLLEWIEAMGPPNRSKPWMDPNARKALLLNSLPVLQIAGYGFIKDFIFGYLQFFSFHHMRRGVLLSEEFIWAIKFAAGFSGLVTMYIYLPEYRALEIPTSDANSTPHFAGWVLIAYAVSTTQTVEGTIKKGILRLVGTCLGGFLGWVAIHLVGEKSVPGLVVWLTVVSWIGAYIGLPRGPTAVMGTSPDYGYGPLIFVMTHTLVIVEVFLGFGGRDQIAANRIAGTCVGVGMAMLMAALPMGIYGGNPKYSRAATESQLNLLLCCLRELLDYSNEKGLHAGNALPESLVLSRCETIQKFISESHFEANLEKANDYCKDASKLHNLPFWKVDPKLSHILESLKVVGSSIETSFSLATFIMQSTNDDIRGSFLSDLHCQQCLTNLILGLENISKDEIRKQYFRKEIITASMVSESSLHTRLFLSFIREAIDNLIEADKEIQTIEWGFHRG